MRVVIGPFADVDRHLDAGAVVRLVLRYLSQSSALQSRVGATGDLVLRYRLYLVLRLVFCLTIMSKMVVKFRDMVCGERCGRMKLQLCSFSFLMHVCDCVGLGIVYGMALALSCNFFYLYDVYDRWVESNFVFGFVS